MSNNCPLFFTSLINASVNANVSRSMASTGVLVLIVKRENPYSDKRAQSGSNSISWRLKQALFSSLLCVSNGLA